ncbi:MAG: hypothetical protein IIA67_03825 [Planctomycetes bacterium]|nr:hypothetical protein [Planctomycetota bacterium]
MNVTDINLDDLTPDQLSEVQNDLQRKLDVYMRHVVAIAGVYETRSANGLQPQTPFYFSATVVEVDDERYFLAAGHALEDIETIVKHSDAKLVRCGIDDTFLHKNDSRPFDFDYSAAARKVHYNSVFHDGLDYALIHIRPYYHKLLAANGIVPLTVNDWAPSAIAACTTFLMAGFPNDSIDGCITHHGDYYRARVKGNPSFIFIERGVSDAQTQFARFVGQIRPEHHVGDITGMSGGPIFCFKDADFDPYYVAGIQSKWNPATRTIFACPIKYNRHPCSQISPRMCQLTIMWPLPFTLSLSCNLVTIQ